MFQTTDIILAAGFARALLQSRASEFQRAQGKPDASCIRWPCVRVMGKSTQASVTNRTSRSSGLPCTTGLTAYSALSSGQLFPVIASNALRLVTRLRDFTFVQLQHQPRVPGPHGFAVRSTTAAVDRVGHDRYYGHQRRPPHDQPKRARCIKRPS